MIILNVLLIALILTAFFAAETADLFAAAVALVAFGFIASLIFALIGALELSIAQLAIEFVLILAVIRVAGDRYQKETYRGIRLFYYGASILSIIVMFLINYTAFSCLPPIGTHITVRPADLARYFRGFDPLVVCIVLLSSVTGLMTVLRKKGKK